MLTKQEIFFLREVILWCNLINKNLTFLIQKGVWPKLEKKHKFLFGILQKSICLLSLKGEDNFAFKLLNRYSFSTLIRVITINKVSLFKKQRTWKANKLKLYFLILIINRNILKNKYISRFSIGSFFDNILQIQLCLLLDAFYEAKYPILMFGFRKGRHPLYVVSFLYSMLKNFCNFSSFGLIYIKLDLTNFIITQMQLMKFFLIPNRWGGGFFKWNQSLFFFFKNEVKNISILYNTQGSIFSLILNVLFVRSILDYFSSFYINFCGGSSTRGHYILFYKNYIFMLTKIYYEINYLCGLFKKSVSSLGFILSCFSYILLSLNNEKYKDYFQFTFLGFTYQFYIKFFNSFCLRFVLDISLASLVLKKIKQNSKNIIIYMRHMGFVKTLYFLNLYLYRVAYYFAFDFGLVQLEKLDYFIFFMVKKYLIKKYRFKGLRRPRWVFKNFISFTKNNFFLKIYTYRSCHPFGLLVNRSVKNYPKYKIIFLVLTSYFFNKISLCLYQFPYIFCFIPFYLSPYLYIENLITIQKQRSLT